MGLVNTKEAIDLLKNGTPVALPTETVYGLACPIASESGLKKIFSIKNRPFNDPLIVHVSGLEMALNLIEDLESDFETLAMNFWPGPLTLVHKKNKEKVSDLITSNHNTVAIRCPQSELFREIIKQTGPLAAPSANLFKKISPTKAEDVLKGLPSVAVLDGGACGVGIESTIYDVHNKAILRPGVITDLAIKNLTNKNVSYVEAINAPGFEKDHYQPQSELWVVSDKIILQSFSDKEFNLVILESDAKEAAKNLYSNIRDQDAKGKTIAVIVDVENLKKPEWYGIKNRLLKASSRWIEND